MLLCLPAKVPVTEEKLIQGKPTVNKSAGWSVLIYFPNNDNNNENIRMFKRAKHLNCLKLLGTLSSKAKLKIKEEVI